MMHEWEQLKAAWANGDRSRETCLRITFFIWYSCAEPPFSSGLEGDFPVSFILEAFERLGGEGSTDSEVLFVFAVMSGVAAFCLGDEAYWQNVGHQFRQQLAGETVFADLFANRGEYGEYFAHQARSRDPSPGTPTTPATPPYL